MESSVLIACQNSGLVPITTSETRKRRGFRSQMEILVIIKPDLESFVHAQFVIVDVNLV